MLTAAGCQSRRDRLWRDLNPPPDHGYLLLADPIHLAYLANFWVDPISLGAGFPGYLLLRKDGHAKLLHDNRLPETVKDAHVDETVVVPWYDGQSASICPRQLAPLRDVNPTRHGLQIHDRPGSPYAATLINTISRLRRQKDPDEIAVLRHCMSATDAGHAWARANIAPGMTELDVYSGVAAACVKAIGRPVIVYGDFAVCPGPERRGGPPTHRVLKSGDMFILDFSVVNFGYRSDFTNTLVVGQDASPAQQRLYDHALGAMRAGENELRAGTPCKSVFDAMFTSFEKSGSSQYFPHHGGHGLGLTHPENPYIVRHADEALLAGDVITLEPGLYVPNLGGLRIEHNYLITETGFECLSNHFIGPR